MTGDTPNQLIAAIRDRIQNPTRATEGADLIPPKIYPPTTDTQLDAAEQTLHLTLPPFLRRLYTEIGNGGFGPGYGLIGVEGGAVAAWLAAWLSDEDWYTAAYEQSALKQWNE